MGNSIDDSEEAASPKAPASNTPRRSSSSADVGRQAEVIKTWSQEGNRVPETTAAASESISRTSGTTSRWVKVSKKDGDPKAEEWSPSSPATDHNQLKDTGAQKKGCRAGQRRIHLGRPSSSTQAHSDQKVEARFSEKDPDASEMSTKLNSRAALGVG